MEISMKSYDIWLKTVDFVTQFIFICWEARGWLKTFGQFWCTGGGWGVVHDFSRLVQTWCRAIFVHRLVGARKQENGVGNHFFWCWKSIFWCWKSIFWWKLGVGNQFFGVRKSWWNFWTVFMKLLEKHGNRAPITHPSRAPAGLLPNPKKSFPNPQKSFQILPHLSKSFQIQKRSFQTTRKLCKSFQI